MTIGAIYSFCISPIQNWAVAWNRIFSRWTDVGNILLWHASFSFFFIKRWSSGFNGLLPPFNDICWPLIRASCYMSLGPPGHSYLVINLHVPNFRFMYMTICFFHQMSWRQTGAGMPRFWRRWYTILRTHLCADIFLYDWTGNHGSCFCLALQFIICVQGGKILRLIFVKRKLINA